MFGLRWGLSPHLSLKMIVHLPSITITQAELEQLAPTR